MNHYHYYHDQARKVAAEVFKRDTRRWTAESKRKCLATLATIAYQEILGGIATRTFAQRLDAATERAAEWLDAN